jgi:TRAP-type C4-dicarboxylate transport system substrate-binding protein
MSRRSVKLSVVGLLAAGAIALTGCSTAAAPAPSGSKAAIKPVNWDMLANFAPNPANGPTNNANLLQAFSDSVKKKTDGAVNITLRAPGELPQSISDCLSVVGTNQVAMCDLGTNAAGESPALGVLALPLLVQSSGDFTKAINALMPFIQKDMGKYGDIVPLFYYAWPPQTIWGTGKPIHQLSDLAGQNVRSSSAAQGQFLSAIGAKPQTVTSAELSTALNQHVVTAVASSAYSILPAGQGDLFQWGYTLSLGYLPGIIVVNKSDFDALPAATQKTIMSISKETQANMLKVIPAAETSARKGLTSQYGIKVVGASKTDASHSLTIAQKVWESWASTNGVSDALKAVRTAVGR